MAGPQSTMPAHSAKRMAYGPLKTEREPMQDRMALVSKMSGIVESNSTGEDCWVWRMMARKIVMGVNSS